MSYHSVLRPRVQRQLKRIGHADLVIGLPSYKNSETAAYTTRIALAGAHKHYPDLRTVLVNADAGRKATTRQAVLEQGSANGHNGIIVSGRYDGLRGQGNATAALLDAGLALDARVIIILDSSTRSINPDWIAGLGHLILENKADLVLPRYRQWATSDGILSDLITYPLFRALWGQSIRYPAAPDFALSPQLATALLDEDIWGTAVATYGLPPWLATYSAVNRWRVVQSALSRKCGLSVEPGYPDQNETCQHQDIDAQFKVRFHDTLTIMLSLIHKCQNHWQTVDHISSAPTLTQFASEINPAPVPTSEIDIVRLLDNLALGWIEYRGLWRQILTSDNLAYVEALASLPPDRFYFPSDLWARIIYDFALIFNKGETDPDQVVSSLFPLYQGRLAAFSQEVAGLASVGREGTVAAQAVEFEEARTYFKERWQSYKPFH
jgi:hypothetical protein